METYRLPANNIYQEKGYVSSVLLHLESRPRQKYTRWFVTKLQHANGDFKCREARELHEVCEEALQGLKEA